MSIEIGTAAPEEVGEFLRPINVAFGREGHDPDGLARFATLLEPDRRHVARESGAIVGAAGAFTYELTVPGGFVPAAGVTVVGVLPTHRRQGILTRLMRAQLDDVRRRGEPVAYLWASEEAIYGRFGYGWASLSLSAEIDARRVTLLGERPAGARVRLVDEDEAYRLIPPVYDRVRAEWPGMFSRSEDWWRKRRLFDAQPQPSSLFRAVLDLDGRPEAYALYRLAMDFASMSATVEVEEAVGTTAEATLEIWRYLASIDLVRTITAGRLPADHPLVLMVDRPRALNMRLGDALWVRLVDVEAALAARALGDAEVVLDVRDAFCEWNAGLWRIGSGGASRTDEPPGLRCDVSALGSTYLGGFTWSQLARAGRVEELAPGAVAAADRLFGWNRSPWCPEIF